MAKPSFEAEQPRPPKLTLDKSERYDDVDSVNELPATGHRTNGRAGPVVTGSGTAAAAAAGDDAGFVGSSSWTPGKGYTAWTKYGEIPMFDDGGHRAVEVMLLAAAACLNFFMVEYVRNRKLNVSSIRVSCDGERALRPERLKRITTRVVVEGTLSDDEIKKMVHVCEGACKVMNTLKHQPECEVVLTSPSGRNLS